MVGRIFPVDHNFLGFAIRVGGEEDALKFFFDVVLVALS